jgi:2-polyprenyl-3-methyl-5-hydroxy-6-metoxy-1,4-benzoquinol methylase
LPTPKELSEKAKEFSSGLGLKDRLLMVWRPRICPFHIIMDHVPDGSSVLDIGCGMGGWLYFLSRFSKISSGVGVEVSAERIDNANSMKTDDDPLEFAAIEVDDDWPGGSYDCLTMIDVLHHVPPAGQKEFMNRISKLDVKKIIFKDIDPKAKIKSFMNSLHDVVLSKQLPRYCEKDKVAAWLEEMGYEITFSSRCDMLWYSHYLITAEKK